MITYLLGKSSTGKFRHLTIKTDEEWHEPEHGYLIERSYGQVGGKTTISPTIIVDKTKQKRTWKEQLELQYNSEVKKVLDKGYIKVDKHPNDYTLEELDALFGDVKTNQYGIIKPQLAKQADKVTNRKIFDKEWMISRKLDGVKALFWFDGKEVHTSSRGGEGYDYSTGHIRHNACLVEFFTKFPKVILDGELFKRGVSLQRISGAARMEKDADNEWLEYWIYDCYHLDNPDMPAKDRQQFLLDTLTNVYNLPGYLNVGDTPELPFLVLEQLPVSGWDNMMNYHNEWVADGYEGAVIKDPDKSYKPGSRGNQLIKIKCYKDSTVRIIGKEEGLRGSEDMVFVCQMKDGRTFKAKPFGTREDKEEYWNNFDTLCKNKIGELKYFNMSDDGVPTQPSMKCIRIDITEPEL